MKIIKYTKKSKDKYQLILDNGEVLDTYEDVILNNNLLYNKEITNTIYQNIVEDNEIQKNYNDCLKYIKSRLRTEKEIRDYLSKKEVTNQNIEIIVKRLINDKLIDDEYFCKCFINDKTKFSSQGEYKIMMELKKEGISEEIINKYSYLFDKEQLQEKMNKLIDKYIKANKKQTGVILKNKIYNNLMNQGYSKEMIISTLNTYKFDE